MLGYSLKHPVATLLTAFALFAVSLGIFKIIGFRLFPTSEKPQFLINLNMPLQSNLETTDKMARYIEAELKREKKIKYYTTNVGKGNPRIYYNVIPENEKPDFAQFFIQLQQDVTPKEKKKLIEQLREKFISIPGAKIEVKDFEQGPPVEATVAIRISGDNLDTLRTLAARAERLLKTTPGAIYVKNDVDVLKSDIKLNINTEKSRTLGIQTADIDKTVRLSIAGLNVGKYTDEDGDDYDIILDAPKENFATVNSFNNIFVNNAIGTPVPIAQVARLEFESSPSTIKHLDKKDLWL